MRRLLALALTAAALLAAQSLDSLAGWQFYRELSTVPGTDLATLTLDADVLANIRDDAADLRLIDAAGNEVPYDLRVLRGSRNAESLQASELNRSTGDDSAEITLDLGEPPPEHNQIQVDTEGDRFRRHVEVFGSDDAEQWTPLNENGLILRLAGNANSAVVNNVPYALNAYRYVRISVDRDQQADAGPPVIQSAAVQRVTVIPGVDQPVPASSIIREAIGEGPSAASQYAIDLPGRIPLHSLRFKTSAGPFTRTYRLLAHAGGAVAPVPIAMGRLARGEGDTSDAVVLRFREIPARQLLLIVADEGDPPLDILDPVVLLSSRQLVADLGAGPAQPLRLYYGNAAAPAPDYGLAAKLPAALDESIPRFELGPQQLNPDYETPPAPLNERAPWLIYVLTGAASLALLAILRSLVFDVDS